MVSRDSFDLRLPALVDGTWGVSRQDNLLVVHFVGHLKEEHGKASIARALSLVGNDEFVIIGDLLDLERYDSSARVAWQNGLLPRKSQIKSVHIASGNRLVSMGVTVFGLFLGMTVNSPRSRVDLVRAASACHRRR